MDIRIEDEVLEIRKDRSRIEPFIKQHKGFVISTVYKTIHRYVTDSDDELQIAMIAFYEAIESYDETKGSFLPFSALVIRRRLIDYLEKESRHGREISVELGAMEDQGDSDLMESSLYRQVHEKTSRLSEEQREVEDGQTAVRNEIEAVQQLLKGYGFSFYDLTECSPKSQKTKSACAEAVRLLLSHPVLFDSMRKSASLPMKEICEQTGIKRKLLERHRRYIIAAAEILNGEYPLLAEYMNYIRKGLSP